MPDASRNNDDSGSNYRVRAVYRVCDVLDRLQRANEGLSLAELADAIKLPKSSAFRYLVSLEDRHYVEHDSAGMFHLGSAFLTTLERQVDLLEERAHPRMELLRDELGETLALSMLDGNEALYLDVVESPNELRIAPQAGERRLLHASAAGKAIAAQLDDAEIRGILSATGTPAFTERTITTTEGALQEFAKVREAGYAVDDREYLREGRAVAVPIPGTHLPAAVAVIAPASRLPREQIPEIAKRLREVVKDIANPRPLKR